jgi:maleylpyruvate isomerase
MLAEHVNSGIQPYQNAVILKWIEEHLPGRQRVWAAHWIGRGLEALEAAARQGAGRYSHGDAVTLADLYLVPQLHGARRFGVEVARFPTLLRIEAACRELEAFARAVPERQPDAPPEKKSP